MIKILDIIVREVDNNGNGNIGCNNGVYPIVKIFYEDDSNNNNNRTTYHTITTQTCRCWNGCSGQAVLPSVGVKFVNIDKLLEYMDSTNNRRVGIE